jgi:alpha-L-rhamnosidase
MYGLIKSSWNLKQSQFTYDITVPANTTASVTLPHAITAKVALNQLPLSASKVAKAEQIGENTIVQLGSGSYQFTYSSDKFAASKSK